MTATEWAAIITALGVGATSKELVGGAIAWLTGRQEVERTRARRIIIERDHAESDRRRMAEHASELRRLLIEKGVPTDELPPWPVTHNFHRDSSED